MRKLGLKHPESVADHSYRLAVMAMAYSDERGLDTERVVKMALLHDLPESLVGDTIPGELTPQRKRSLEASALREIMKDLPSELRREYTTIWNEYEERRSPEAKLVFELDKVEMAIQAREYLSKGEKKWVRSDVEEFIHSARSRVVDTELVDVIDGAKGMGSRPIGRSGGGRAARRPGKNV